MNNYKRFTIFTFIFLLLIIILQFSLDSIYKKRTRQKFILIFKHQVDEEIMIFGSSIAYHHFDPQIINKATNLSTYNMGWEGVFFVQYAGLIREYLSYEKKCKYIIIASDFSNLGKNNFITRPDLFYPYINNSNIYRALHNIEPYKIFLARYIPGYKITLYGKNFYNNLIFPIDDRINNGYQPINSDSFSFNGDKEGKTVSYEENVYNELKDLIKVIIQKNIKIIFVMSPIYCGGYKQMLNTEFIKNKYKSLTNKNVFFLDYTNDTLSYLKKYYFSNPHLNYKGATIFTNTFSNDLLKIIDSTK